MPRRSPPPPGLRHRADVTPALCGDVDEGDADDRDADDRGSVASNGVIIEIGPNGVVNLADPTTFTAFHVSGDRDAAIAHRDDLRHAGIDLADDSAHAWVEVDALRRLAGPAVDEAWEASLTGMVQFAESKGWTDQQGRLRAHCDWPSG